MAKDIDLAKLFGVENLVTKKTLLNETQKDIIAKSPNYMSLDIRALLDELNKVISQDLQTGIGKQSQTSSNRHRTLLRSYITSNPQRRNSIMAKDIDLAKLFGVENLVTKKTLLNETQKDIIAKSPNDMSLDIRALLDELNNRVISQDILGVIECLRAIQIRLDVMNSVALTIKKSMGK